MPSTDATWVPRPHDLTCAGRSFVVVVDGLDHAAGELAEDGQVVRTARVASEEPMVGQDHHFA